MKLTLVIFLFLVNSLNAYTIINTQGVDSQVDYLSLVKFGPWDDRNYLLTKEDLSWLSEREQHQYELVPAFYRIQYRKNNDVRTNGKAQYPRSMYNYFLMEQLGYFINGQFYSKLKWDNSTKTYQVVTQDGKTISDIVINAFKTISTDILVHSGAESAISIHPTNPNAVIAGVNSAGVEMLYSTNAGLTWSSAPDLSGTECCDPTLDWKSDGSYAYAVTLGAGQVWFFRSENSGKTWDSLTNESNPNIKRILTGPNGTGNDKEYIHVDKSPTSPFLDYIYITWHESNFIQFAVSSDDGNTFTTQSFTSEPKGIGSDIVTAADGTIYHFWPAFQNNEIRMNKSMDGGLTFSPSIKIADTLSSFIFPIPSMDLRQVFIYTSVDMDNTGGIYNNRLYVSWTDSSTPQTTNPAINHSHIQVAYSDDFGATWVTSTPHNTSDLMLVDRWHQWLKVDKNGIVHVVYYDTRHFPNRAGVDMYHSFSSDGGQTWSNANRITTQSSPASSGFQFGDYNGMDFGSNGEGIAIFSDNRGEDGGSPDMDVYVSPVSTVNRFIDRLFWNGFERDLIFTNGFE